MAVDQCNINLKRKRHEYLDDNDHRNGSQLHSTADAPEPFQQILAGRTS
jgi:hypothetical protein